MKPPAFCFFYVNSVASSMYKCLKIFWLCMMII
uniref:Uncharacterized protein n=1 Tax=Arundo donax TaxID=35708 RepID=A0A0A9APC8_ARUDO